VQASAGSKRVVKATVSARQLEGGHARAECEGQARVRTGPDRAVCEPGRVRAEPSRVRAEPGLGQVVMARPSDSRARTRIAVPRSCGLACTEVSE
jgi:hypothetical protein